MPSSTPTTATSPTAPWWWVVAVARLPPAMAPTPSLSAAANKILIFDA